MIEVNLYGLSNNDNIELLDDKIKIIIKGHANFDKNGKDIVCAAVSTLIQTIIYAVQKLTKFEQKITKEEDILAIEIKISDRTEDNKKLLIILETIFISLKEIYSKYPKNLKIEYY